jgi:hypothetical protein
MESTVDAERERRLELARRVFKEYYAQCFWSWDSALEIRESDIPHLVEGLRENGGHQGYRLARELCR